MQGDCCPDYEEECSKITVCFDMDGNFPMYDTRGWFLILHVLCRTVVRNFVQSCEGFCGHVSSGDDKTECECDELCLSYQVHFTNCIASWAVVAPEVCLQMQDCCNDYTEQCSEGGLGKGEKAGTAPCVEGDCGSCKVGILDNVDFVRDLLRPCSVYRCRF